MRSHLWKNFRVCGDSDVDMDQCSVRWRLLPFAIYALIVYEDCRTITELIQRTP